MPFCANLRVCAHLIGKPFLPAMQNFCELRPCRLFSPALNEQTSATGQSGEWQPTRKALNG